MPKHLEHGACTQERANNKECCHCQEHEHCGFIWSSSYTSTMTEENLEKCLKEYRRKRRNGWIIVFVLIGLMILAVLIK